VGEHATKAKSAATKAKLAATKSKFSATKSKYDPQSFQYLDPESTRIGHGPSRLGPRQRVALLRYAGGGLRMDLVMARILLFWKRMSTLRARRVAGVGCVALGSEAGAGGKALIGFRISDFAGAAKAGCERRRD
jgi:hypothetical protein